MVQPPKIAPPRVAPGKGKGADTVKQTVAPPRIAGKVGDVPGDGTTKDARTGTWRTVLVVEPDAELRERLVRILREAATDEDGEARELAILEAEDGSAAWTLADTARPDMVVAEILLEGMSGLQLLRRLRERYPDDCPRVLFVTTMANEVDRYWALRNGASAFVIKPFEDAIVRERSTKLLRNDQPRREGSWHSRL